MESLITVFTIPQKQKHQNAICDKVAKKFF